MEYLSFLCSTYYDVLRVKHMQEEEMCRKNDTDDRFLNAVPHINSMNSAFIKIS